MASSPAASSPEDSSPEDLPLAVRCINRLSAGAAELAKSPRSPASSPTLRHYKTSSSSANSDVSSGEDFDPSLHCSDSLSEAAASWSQGGSGAKPRRASADDGAVFSSALGPAGRSDEDIFARRRRQSAEEGAATVAAAVVAADEAAAVAAEEEAAAAEAAAARDASAVRDAAHADADAGADPAASEQAVERELKKLLHTFVRSQWALFETQTNLHVQLRHCATQLTSAAPLPTLPAQLIEEASQQTAQVEALKCHIEERGSTLQGARHRHEASLGQDIETRRARMAELSQRLADEQLEQARVTNEAAQLERMRLACDEGEPAIAALRSELAAAEDEISALSASSEQLLRSHSEAAAARQVRAAHEAAMQSQRETAALYLHLGQAKQAATVLDELEKITTANAQVTEGQVDPEPAALQLLAEAQLRHWSDAAFPVVSKRTELIRRQAAICWGITLEDDVTAHTPRAAGVTAPKMETPPVASVELQGPKPKPAQKLEQPSQSTKHQDVTPPPAPAAAQISGTLDTWLSLNDGAAVVDNTSTSETPTSVPGLPSMIPTTPARRSSGSGVPSMYTQAPPSTGKRRRNCPYTADDDIALLQYVSEHGLVGALADTYWSKAVDANLLQSQDPEKPSRTAGSLRERWRKILRPRYEAAGGNIAVAVAAQHAAPASTGRGSAGGSAGGRRSSLDGGAGGAGRASTTATPQRQGGSSGRRQQVPKAVANALWRRDCGESFSGACSVCENSVTVHNFEAGHVVSDNHGGAPELHNLRVICPPCNKSCGTKNLFDFKAEFFGTQQRQQAAAKEAAVVPAVIDLLDSDSCCSDEASQQVLEESEPEPEGAHDQ